MFPGRVLSTNPMIEKSEDKDISRLSPNRMFSPAFELLL